MTPRLLSVSCGLLAALVSAAALKFALFDFGAPETSHKISAFAQLAAAFGFVAAYVLPLALTAVLAAEIIRLRRPTHYMALGIFLGFVAAHFSVRGEDLTSQTFSGGTLTGLALLIAGIVSGLIYWAIAGRQAGWRGDSIERTAAMTAEAFRTASANAETKFCKECAAGLLALGLLVFVLTGWALIDATGLRAGLISETEAHGKAALKKAGYVWATFKVDGDRGVIEGLAPDEVEKRAAFDSVREALSSVTGFPGVLSKIKNEAVARMLDPAVSQKLADAAQREAEAKAAIETARAAADAARAAEVEAKLNAQEQVSAAETESKRRAEEQARAAEEDSRNKTAALAELQRKIEDQAKAAEAEARKTAAAQPPPAPAPAQPPPAQPPPAQAVEVAAAEPGGNDVSHPQVGDDEGASSPALDPPPRPVAGACTSQDLALIESSRILFELQKFDVQDGYNGELDRVAASAQSCTPRPVLVTGYADSNGDNLFNRALGLQRALAVRDELVSRGVPATLVIAKVTESPAVSHADATREERALYRRTDFRLIEASEISRDATQTPDERATTCESDLSGIMSQSTIYFATASARVGEENAGLINKLAKAIETCGSVVVTIEGHTDKIGGPIYNQGLSETRANAVREALVAAGANPTRVTSRGFSSNRPSDPADTAAAFALNRRIEFKVSGKFTSSNTGGP